MQTDDRLRQHPTFWRRLRLVWQRRNTFTAINIPLAAWHEASNDGHLTPPPSDIHWMTRERMQDVRDLPLAPSLGQEGADHEPKNRLTATDMRTYLATARGTAEKANGRHMIEDLWRAMPTIDAKSSADWEATVPNKEVLPSYLPDAELARRIQFTRYLVQRGTFNEGFGDDTIPKHYRTFSEYFDSNAADRNEEIDF